MAGYVISQPVQQAELGAPAAAASVRRRLAASVSARFLVAAGGTAAVLVAVVGQDYLNRKVFLADAVYLYAWAIALFIVAFHSGVRSHWSGRTALVVRVLLCLLAFVAFAVAYTNLAHNRNFVVSVVLLFLPLALLGAAFAGSRLTSRPDDEPDAFLDNLWQRLKATPSEQILDRFYIIAGMGFALAATAYWLKPDKSNEALVLNVLSGVFLLLAAWRLDRGKPVAVAQEQTDAPALRLQLIVLAAIVAVGAFLRLWQLTSIPYGVWFDEGQTGLEALRIVRGMPFTPMGTFEAANPSLFFYIIAFVFKIMGPTLLAVRLVQAMTGLLTVVIFYPFLRDTLGWRAAAAGALLLAVSSWHVNWSRFGMPYSIGAPLFEILSAYLLLRALRTGRLTTFALAGLAIGFGLYTYFGFRLFPFALAAYLLYGLIFNKERVRQSIPGLLVFGIIALIVLLPQAMWAWQHRTEFLARTAQTSVFAGKNTPQERMAALENSLRRHVQMINLYGDGNGRHNIPGAPALDLFSGALFVLGLGYALYRWRSPIFLLLTVWFVVGMLAGIMSLDWEAPQQHRTLVAIPAIYGLAALVFGKVWSAWDKYAVTIAADWLRKAVQAVVVVAVVLLFAGTAYVNYNRYFHLQMGRSDVFYSFSTIETAVARRVAELGPTTNRYYIQNQGSPALSFLAGGDVPERPVDSVFYRAYEDMPLREPITKTAVFLLEPWRVTIEPADVLRYYPNAVFVDHKDPFGQSIVYEFRVQPEDAYGLLGLEGRYYAGDQPQGAPVLERTDKTVDFDWTSASPLAVPFNVEWSGSAVAPSAGVYTFDLPGDGQVKVSLDSQWLELSPDSRQVRVDLAKGMHPVVIQFSGQRIALYWTPPTGQRQLVPMTALLAVGWPEHGLVARYYKGENWQGRPEFVQVDPYLAFRWHPDPIEPGPWSTTWTGKIDVPKDGKYVFQGVCNDRFWLIIDGQTYMNGVQGVYEVGLDLTTGRHDIQVKYNNNKGYSELRLSWRTPDGRFEVVPNSVLYVR